MTRLRARAALLAPLLTALAAPFGLAQTPVAALFEARDGRVRDQAVSTQANYAGYVLERLWVAAGRTRQSYQLDNQARIASEDRPFQLSAYAEGFERVHRIEVDHVNKRIYTLSDRGLYRQSIAALAAPAAPGTEVFFDFFASPTPLLQYDPNHTTAPKNEEVRDLRVWGPSMKVVVLTSKRLLIFNDNGGSTNAALSLVGQTTDLDPAINASQFADPTCNPAGTNVFALRKVTSLHKLRLMKDANDKVMAYVLAEATGYLVSTRPRPLILMLAHVDAGPAGSPWSAPTFDADPAAGVVNYAWWDPMPTSFLPPASNVPDAADWTAYNLDVAAQGTSRFVFVGCGSQNEVQQVNVTNAFPRTCALSDTAELSSTKIALSALTGIQEKVLNVAVDHVDPLRIFAQTPSRLYAHQGPALGGTTYVQADEIFGSESAGDMQQVSWPASDPQLEVLYSLGGAVVGYLRKTLDVTTNNATVATAPKAISKSYGMWGSDGAVMIGDRIFVPTFSGVAQFNRYPSVSSSGWEIQADAFQSTEDPLHAPFQITARATEHVDTAKIPGAASPMRVVTASVNGGFDEFEFDPASNKLNPMIRHTPTLVPVAPSPWNWPGGPFYGNDVAFFDMGNGSTPGQQFILTDLTSSLIPQGPLATPRTAALLAWQWVQSPAPAKWVNTVFQDTYTFASSLAGAGIPITDTIAITKVPGTPDKWFAFVTTGESFYSADISALNSATPSITVKTAILCNNQQKVRAGGIVAEKDRLFVFVNGFIDAGGLSVPPELRMYQWNTVSGVIGNVLGTLPLDTTTPTSVAYKLSGAYRLRYVETNATTGEGDVFVSTDCGEGVKSVLLRLHWAGGTATNTTLAGYWRSDSEDPLQDSRPYTLTTGQQVLLVVKDRETFAVVQR